MLNAVIIARTKPRRQRLCRFICIYCCTFRGDMLFILIQLTQFFPHKAMDTCQHHLSPLSIRISGRYDRINKEQKKCKKMLGKGTLLQCLPEKTATAVFHPAPAFPISLPLQLGRSGMPAFPPNPPPTREEEPRAPLEIPCFSRTSPRCDFL